MNQKYIEICKILNEMMGNVSVAIHGFESLPRRVVNKKRPTRLLKKKA